MASAVTTTVTLSFRLLGSLLRPLPCRLESAHTPLSGDRTPKLWLLPPGGGWEELRLAMVPMAGQVRPAGHLQAWQSELAHTCAGGGRVQCGQGGGGLGVAARVDRGTEPGGGRSPEWMEPRCRDRAPGGWSGWLGPSPTVVKQPPEASTPQTPLGAGPSGAGWGTGSSRTPSAQGPALGRGHGCGVLGVGWAQGACGPGFGCAGLRVQLPPWPPGSAGRDHKAVP